MIDLFGWLLRPFREYRKAKEELKWQRRFFHLTVDLWEALLDGPPQKAQHLADQMNEMLRVHPLEDPWYQK